MGLTPPAAVRDLGQGDPVGLGAGFGSDLSLVALAFDLSRPLQGQVEQAERYLQIIQHRRMRGGTLALANVAGRRGRWIPTPRLLGRGGCWGGP